MSVCKRHFDKINEQRGSSILEVIMAITVVLAISPFMYNQIITISDDVKDIAMANKIVKSRDAVVNFLRVNQTQWPDTIEVKLSDKEIEQISPMAHAAFVDNIKQMVQRIQMFILRSK